MRERNADRRLAGDNGGARNAAEEDVRPSGAPHESVERFQRTELAFDHGGERLARHVLEQAVERVVDDGFAVAEPSAQRAGCPDAFRKVRVAPAFAGVGERVDDLTRAQRKASGAQRRASNSSASSEQPRGAASLSRPRSTMPSPLR